ncbi:family 1 glycosylhydrolase [Salipaludibacillus sp. LMS25]|uniref:family 1 glycosylhydrolase n=1 Tax=Salipaludibacillus sp. LMS25 TaxID=2924031 RepID=UPI0020CFFF4A|nr:family 1 glycosylhydrolase [Salipaludibacillus sp. LMS25]UTR16534.1 family 1 glycosylhydrolase [Salipaludibacillus sp. LMS25]
MAIIQFPNELKRGDATAYYQIKGSDHKTGKGLLIWPILSKKLGEVVDDNNGDGLCDTHHRYEEAIQRMKEHGVYVYYYSVGWQKIFPNETGEV